MSEKREKRIEAEMHGIRRLLIKQHPPQHFSLRNVSNAFFGSLILGLSFIFNGLLFQVGLKLTPLHMIVIVMLTLLLLTGEIYFIGYARVDDKHRRHFGQFWLKRICAFYGIAVCVALGLIVLYGLDKIAGSAYAMVQLTVAVSMPCAIGTALSDLLR